MVSIAGEPGSVQLPPAPPDDYLRWMAFWRQVEQAMAARPALEHYASSVSAPFLQGEIAEFISGVLVTEIIRQAAEARRRGQREVAPVIRASREVLVSVVGYIRRRGRWMEETVSLELAGVDPLEPELLALRKRAIRALELSTEADAALPHARAGA
jgi:hypothetical protein